MTLNKIEQLLNEHVNAHDNLYYQYMAFSDGDVEPEFTMTGKQAETILFLLSQKIEQLRNAYSALKEVDDVVSHSN